MSFTVDTTGFTKMAQSLSKMSGTALAPVILAETGKILEGCVRRTKVASAAAIRKSVAFRNRNLWTDAQWPPKLRGDIVIATNKAGTRFFVDNPGKPSYAKGRRVGKKVFYDMTNYRWSDARWARFQEALAELKRKQTDLAKALKARGLMAHTWYQIAQALGIDISVPGYVKNAAPSSGKTYVDGSALRFEDADSFFVDIFNKHPFLVRSGGATILQDAITARLNHFYIAVQKGVFENVKARAEQFPGVFVS